ncbi:Os06g0644200 [Oryza sativa Japonica Group]|uniref:H(+)-exporting diphosphatase n=2 Tax=Oryza sativa subsp. japonica TaxID=39947 RepID=Q67WN4_ORYSJ|nr:inorganic diphosphatase, H+-translocating, vacuolar membrane -like [Oryza sativa Japonica Group]BAS98839.1 Os06g0644200 [Oryza sativa Japonica Group]
MNPSARISQVAMAAILPDLATQVLVPAAAVVGIAFAVVQWVLVSKVKMTAERRGGEGSPGAAAGKDGGAASEYLIEEEEGLNEHNVVEKCSEIQHAISEGEGGGLTHPRVLFVFFFLAFFGWI